MLSANNKTAEAIIKIDIIASKEQSKEEKANKKSITVVIWSNLKKGFIFKKS